MKPGWERRLRVYLRLVTLSAPGGRWASEWLTPARQRYAWIVGAALWGGWLASLLLGRDGLDRAGQVIGPDYLPFYAAGWMLRHGLAVRLYDPEAQLAAERAVFGPHLPTYHPFLNPPFFALLFVPFSLLPYTLSFALWSLLQLGLLALGIWALRPQAGARWFGWALTFLPVFASVSFGQNGLLSLALLALAWRLWDAGRPGAAGGIAGLLLYKPHLLIGPALVWLLEGPRGWRALGGLATTAALLALLSALALPEATAAYGAFAWTVYPDLPAWEGFPRWHLHTLRGFWRLLLSGAPRLADRLTLLLAPLGVVFGAALRRAPQGSPSLRLALGIPLTFWLAPYAMIYDLSLLLIPAVRLWEEIPEGRPIWRSLFAGMWTAALLSGPLAVGMGHTLGWALQISIPVLAGAMARVGWALARHPENRGGP